MLNSEKINIDECFLKDIMQCHKHSWPFKDDFSDVEVAYTETIDIKSNINKYVLLKKDCIMLLEFAFDTMELKIIKIFLNKINSCQETSKSNDIFGFKNLIVKIVLQNGESYELKEPHFETLKSGEHRKFIQENILNYNCLVNKIME